MQTPEEFAREWLGCHVEIVEPGLGAAGTRYCGKHHHPWLHDVDMCPVQERAAVLIRARDAEVAEAARAETRYVVFDADWCEPPGDVIAVFATKAEAWAHIRGPGDGYGWSIVEVPAPAVEP